MYAFNTWQVCYWYVVNVHEGVKCQKIFFTILQHFELSQFSMNAHMDNSAYILNQLLIELSVYHLNTWHVCYRHIEDGIEKFNVEKMIWPN